jgi:ankyrin repeat protein
MSYIESRTAFESIKALCSKSETRPESELVELLESIIQSNPLAVRERDERDLTLLHYAAPFRSVTFVKRLVEADGGRECVETTGTNGWLPIHMACNYGNVGVAKYLLLLYPESTNVRDNDGYSSLHVVVTAVDCTEEDREEFTRFLILHDQGALAMPNRLGNLPLHLACRADHQNLSVVKLLFDANPNAMEIQNNNGSTPLDLARHFNRTEILAFLQSEPDVNGQLPIHRVLQITEPSLGTIKLMVAANRAILTTADDQGCLPLHLACSGGKSQVVNYILKRSKNYGVSSCARGKLPLELLLSNAARCDRNSIEFVEAVFRLIRANPQNIDKLDVHASPISFRLLRANPETITKFSVAQEEHASPISWNLLLVIFIYMIILLMCWLK